MEPVDASPDLEMPDVALPSPTSCAGYAIQWKGALSYASLSRPVQDDFTIEAWIKTTASAPGTYHWQGLGVIFADVMGNFDDFGSAILNNHFAFGVGNPPGQDVTIESTSTVTTGAWTHVAATRRMSTGEIQVLVNGILETSRIVATQTRSLTSSLVLDIGGDVIDKGFFNGEMDEVRLWTVVRSPTEIAASMHAVLTGNEPGLVGYRRFDDVDGPKALDSSPTNASTTLFAPAWTVSTAPVCDAPDAGVP
jgi:hypothetical protein